MSKRIICDFSPTDQRNLIEAFALALFGPRSKPGKRAKPPANPTNFEWLQQQLAELAAEKHVIDELMKVVANDGRIYAVEILAKDADGRPCFIGIGETDLMKGQFDRYCESHNTYRRKLNEDDPLDKELMEALKGPRVVTSAWKP